MRMLAKAYRPLLLLIIVFFILSFPQRASALSPRDILSSPDSLVVKIQERIEYFFAFNTEKKAAILEKQAERRLTRAKKLIKTKDVDEVSTLIKNYETLKEKQGDLVESASIAILPEIKERTIEQQKRIEDIKEAVPEETKEVIEDVQRTVVTTVIMNVRAKEGEGKATEFAEGVKEVLTPGSNVLEVVPGENTMEISPEVAPGSENIEPGKIDLVP